MDADARTPRPEVPAVVLIGIAVFVATMSYESRSFPLPPSERAALVSAAPSPSEYVQPPFGISVGYPSYSPDGREVAFSTEWRGNSQINEIFAVSTVDGRLHVVVSKLVEKSVAGTRWYGAGGPAWSPDGKWIAFPATRPVRAYDFPQSGIWLVRPDGSGLTPLRTSGLWMPGELAWSPDGTQIAFTAKSDIRLMSGNPVALYDMRDIWIINADGSGLRRATNQSWTPNLSRSAYYPSFSPDGKQIVFSQGNSGEGMGPCAAGNKLVIIDTDGASARQLTSGDALDFHSSPSWSKRGILFQSYLCGSTSAIKMIQPNGTGLQTILNGTVGQPTWSPNAVKFAFIRAGDYAYNVSGYGLYEFDLSSGMTRALVQIRGYFISIDIMPESSSTTISLKEVPMIKVVIPMQPDFDPKKQADEASVTFGRTGEEPSMSSCSVDGTNFVCLFKTELTGFRPGDTQGILRIVTRFASDPSHKVRLEGRGTIQIVP